jgi:DedD protein
MALFKFGGKSREPAAPPSVETLRRRARQRLLGAAILVAAAVVGFPMVFDAPPRPVAVDVPIVVPDKAQMAPLPSPAAVPQPAPTSPAQPAASGSVAVTASPTAAPKPALTPAPTPPISAPAASQAASPAPSLAATQAAKTTVNAASAPSAKASAPSKPAAVTRSPELAALPATGRYVVQVGAFADPAKVREVRQKVERAGLKTYTQDVVTEEGKRTRVRVGPLATKAEAERVAARLKTLGLTGAVLFL